MKLLRIINRLSDVNFYKCLYKRKFLWVLQKVYNFNNWHVNAPYECRLYKRVLVNEINKLAINNVGIEIGGGLGDIISRINVNKKYLIDMDINLKKAVNFLYKDIIFLEGSFDEVLNIKENNIDVMILVNWIHEVPKSIIMQNIYNIMKFKNIKYLVVDEINENIEGYTYKHCFNDIEGFITLKTIDDPEHIRKFRILKWQS